MKSFFRGDKQRAVPKWLRILLPSVVVVVWLVLGAIGGPQFGKISEVSTNDMSSFLPESAEATKVNELLKDFQDTKTLPAIVVFESKNNGDLNQADLTAISETTDNLQSYDKLADKVSPPTVSDDNQAAFIVLPLQAGIEEPGKAVEEIKSIIAQDISDLDYRVTGPLGYSADLSQAFEGIDGLLLVVALAVVFVILVFVYRSVVLPFVVLLTSLLALCASIIIVIWLAKLDVVQINGQVQGILFILVIGAATDYSLLFVSRYREALYEFKDKIKAIQQAYKGAFEPIIASGGTVVVGLLCLLLSDLGSNKALGPVGSIGIVLSVVSALTFLPAVLYIFGRGSFWPVRPSASKQAKQAHAAKLKRGVWHNVGGLVTKYSRPLWIGSTLLLLLAAYFSTELNAGGIAQTDLVIGQSDTRDGQAILDKHFAGGSGSPAQIIISSKDYQSAVQKLDMLEGVDGVVAAATGVEASILPLGKNADEIKAEIRSGIEEGYSKRSQPTPSDPALNKVVDNAYPFKDAVIKQRDGTVLLQATLTSEPDSQAAKDTIETIRGELRMIDSEVLVGGITATQLDTNTQSNRDRIVIIPVILFAITVILMLLLRSIVAPILLLASTILSFLASLGVAALVFQHLIGFPSSDPSVVLFGFVFLVALGIDYNIFLMTRVREEAKKIGTDKGVITGLVVTGGVITSAGIVLAATFAALSVLPVVFLVQISFIVAFGVLLDTFLVRSILVPALIKDIGPLVWWPSKLWREKVKPTKR